MGHLLAKHPFPHVHVNIALVVAIVWAGLAIVSAFLDIARMVETW